MIGLLVGTVAFGLTLTRTRLYAEDLAAIEHAVALLPPGGHPTTTTPTTGAPAPGTGIPSPMPS